MLYLLSSVLLLVGLACINLVFAYQSKHIDPRLWPTIKYQLLMLPLFFLANLSVGYGIRFGLKASQRLAFALISAKCLEILISVGVGYLFLKESPTRKTWIGLGVIAAGLALVKQK